MLLRILVLILAAIFLSVMMIACGDDDNPVDPTNHAPVIDSMTADPDTFQVDVQTTSIVAFAHDPDGDKLGYTWEDPGWPVEIVNRAVNPAMAKNCCNIDEITSAYCVVEVSDGRGGKAIDSIQVWVRP